MEPKKTIMIESSILFLSLTLIGLLLISSQPVLAEFLDTISSQVKEITRIASDPYSFR